MSEYMLQNGILVFVAVAATAVVSLATLRLKPSS